MRILEEFWYGNIEPMDLDVPVTCLKLHHEPTQRTGRSAANAADLLNLCGLSECPRWTVKESGHMREGNRPEPGSQRAGLILIFNKTIKSFY